MTCINKVCADVGTANCPCPLAETGDCIVCSRLAGRLECDCSWSGVCVFNEYIQNDKIVRGLRQEKPVKILKKTEYSQDLFVLALEVGMGFALAASKPGSFVFLRKEEKPDYYGTPVSIMRTDAERGLIYLTVKELSAKTKLIAEAEESIIVRGIYRNGLLGGGAAGLEEDVKKDSRWLIFTKGVGFAPAVNLLDYCRERVSVDMVVDTDKICQEIVLDHLDGLNAKAGSSLSIRFEALSEIFAEGSSSDKMLPYEQGNYDRIMILASDYYIDTIKDVLKIPGHKLVYCNNFRMCCGEGICGACSVVDEKGNVIKMCKCTGR